MPLKQKTDVHAILGCQTRALKDCHVFHKHDKSYARVCASFWDCRHMLGGLVGVENTRAVARLPVICPGMVEGIGHAEGFDGIVPAKGRRGVCGVVNQIQAL
jgi:hypothetical protein